MTIREFIAAGAGQIIAGLLLTAFILVIMWRTVGTRLQAIDKSIAGHAGLLDSVQQQIDSTLLAVELVKQRTTWLLDRAMADRTAEWAEIDKALADFRVTKGLHELEDHLARIHQAHNPDSHEPGS